MRMRFKPYAGPELAACPFCVDEPMQNKGRWNEQFARPAQPLMLELGCGKGKFLAQMAVAHPENNYIGIDITAKVLILTKRNIDRAYAQAGREVDNVRILTHDIERIRSMMGEGDRVSRIYINFCNPWNRKKGHKKHRLTHSRQLEQYRDFLVDGGEVWFKCDDEDLFEDSVGYLEEMGFAITWLTRDLHANEPAWNIRTEHEAMFAEMGIPIKALIAKKLPGEYFAPKKEKAAAGGRITQTKAAAQPGRRAAAFLNLKVQFSKSQHTRSAITVCTYSFTAMCAGWH